MGHIMGECPGNYEGMFRENMNDDILFKASEGKHRNTDVETCDDENKYEQKTTVENKEEIHRETDQNQADETSQTTSRQANDRY